MTADELIRRAAACLTCGKEHESRKIGPTQWTWADRKDEHAYRPALENPAALERLRGLAGAK